MAAKNEPTENIASVIETLEILIARKKNIQWIAIRSPTKISVATVFSGSTKGFLVISKYRNRNAVASNIRYQTNDASRTEINSPNTAVNPQMKTIRWSCR